MKKNISYLSKLSIFLSLLFAVCSILLFDKLNTFQDAEIAVAYECEIGENFVENQFETQKVGEEPMVITINWCEDNFVYNASEQIITASYVNKSGYEIDLKVEILGGLTFKNAGTYTAEASFAHSETEYVLPATTTKEFHISKAVINMDSVAWDYEETNPFVYDGNQKTVLLKNVPSEVQMVYTGNKNTEVGFYSAQASVTYDSQNYETPSQLLYVLDWQINKQQIVYEQGDWITVIVSSEKGIEPNVAVFAVMIVENDVDTSKLLVDYYNLKDKEKQLNKNEKVGLVFEICLFRVNGTEREQIQIQDLKGVTFVNIKFMLKHNINTSKITKVFHASSPESLKMYNFDKSKLTRDGYYEMNVSDLSEFAFVYDTHCVMHWYYLLALALFVLFVLIRMLRKNRSKFGFITFIGCSLYVIAIAIITVLAYNCTLCNIFLIIDLVVLLAGATLMSAMASKLGNKSENTEEKVKNKDEKIEEKVQK